MAKRKQDRPQELRNKAHDIVYWTISGKLTHSEFLQRIRNYWDEVGKLSRRQLPRYELERLRGYCEIVFDTKEYRDGKIRRKLATAHYYKGTLYWTFEQWRKAWPGLNGSELTDSCCSVWREPHPVSGQYKVFSKYTHTGPGLNEYGFRVDEAVEGQWFPAYGPVMERKEN